MPTYTVFKPSGDVWVAVPSSAMIANVTLGGPEQLAVEMATQDDFQLLRIIGNLKFSGKDEEEYFVFRPPARLQVRFTPDDLNRAQRRGKPLSLAYWYEGRWVRLPPGNMPAAPEEAGAGWAYFVIHDIPDPSIAWGT